MSTTPRLEPSRSPTPSAGAAAAPVHPARRVLVELGELLEAERAALVRLDREAIGEYANRKLELDRALVELTRDEKLGAEDQELLARVREIALSNRLLLAHARSCVQGVLSLLSPANSPRYTAPGHTTPSAHSAPETPPVALNLRR